MPVIGVAEVLVKPSFQGAQQAVGRELDSIAVIEGDRAGKTMGQRLGGALKVGALAVSGAAISGLGVALTKGFGRLQAIEQAKAKLSGLGHDVQSVTTIMNDAMAAVKGTAFGMDEAATVAAGAVAAGVKPGKELERTLRLTGDAATIAGVGMSDMGAIFNKVASSNKVQGDVIAQLNDAGIPIVQLLGKELGTTAEQTLKLASEGKINFETFQKAMDAGLGGAALKSGDTLQGAFKNVMASVSRIGANLLSGVYPMFTKFFQGLIKWMEPLEATAKVAGVAIGLWMQSAADKLVGLHDVLIKGDFTTAFREAFNVEEDSDLVGFLFGLRTFFIDTFTEMRGGLSAFGAAWRANDGDVTSSGFPGFMERAAYFTHQLVDAARQLDFSSVEGFFASLSTAGGTAGGAFASIGDSLQALTPAFQEFFKILPEVSSAMTKVAGVALNVLVGALSFLADHVDTIIAWMPAIVAGFIAWRIAQSALTSGTLAMQGAQLLMTPVITLNNILRIAAIRLENQQTQATIANTLAQSSNNAAANTGVLAQMRGALASAALRVSTVASTVAMWAQTAAQRALNLAMSANPIGLVVVAIAALVAGLVWFFTQTELGQQIVQNVWGAIQTFIGGTVAWFQTYVLPVILTVFRNVGAVFEWLWLNIIQPVFGFIGAVIGAWWTVTEWIFSALVAVIQRVIAPAIMWLWTNVFQPVFGFIGALISTWWNFIVKPIFDGVVWFVNNVLGPAFNWLYQNVIKPQFEAIGAIIKWVWENTIKPVFDFLSDAITKTIPKAFEDGVNFIKTHWDKIQDIAKAPVKFVVDTVINKGLIAGLNGIGSFLQLPKLPDVSLNGFANGGYTGPGGKYKPAGIVHAGEVVWSQDDISRWGGVGVVEALRKAKGYFTGGLVHPLPGSVVSQPFHGGHNGMDFAAGTGTPIRAAGPGRVSSAGWSSYGGGNEIHIDHPNGLQTWYAHLSSFAVKLGQMVTGGSKIGEVGSTGNSTGPHLHYMVLNGGWPNYRNPAEYLAGGGAGGDGGFNPIAGIVDGLVDQFKKAFPGAGMFADLAIGAGKKILDGAVDFVTGQSGKDNMGATGLPYLHDQGGILPPGLSQVVNRTRKPEYILNPQQWNDIHSLASAGGRGGVNFNGPVHVRDENELARILRTSELDAMAVYH